MSPNLPHAISVEHAIQSLTVRTNHGLDGPLGYKLPPILCLAMGGQRRL
jgi:hypothetical protein